MRAGVEVLEQFKLRPDRGAGRYSCAVQHFSRLLRLILRSDPDDEGVFGLRADDPRYRGCQLCCGVAHDRGQQDRQGVNVGIRHDAGADVFESCAVAVEELCGDVNGIARRPVRRHVRTQGLLHVGRELGDLQALGLAGVGDPDPCSA